MLLWFLLHPTSVVWAAISGDGAHATFQRRAEEGWQALQKGNSDSALNCFLDAQRLGMSRDSLYYFFSEAALRKSAFDTALVFNLSMTGTPEGAFRDSVLTQRYNIYARAGMTKDAAALRDSLPSAPSARHLRRHTLDFRLGAGYFREGSYPVRQYPFVSSLGDFLAHGVEFRNRALLLWPLAIPGQVPWSLGIDYEIVKSYAKDSIDCRTGLQLKGEDLIIPGLAVSLMADMGSVTGTGQVTSYKAETSYLSFSDAGITLAQGGYESEWNGAWERRFDGIWASFYHDGSIMKGHGFNFSLSASGIRVAPAVDRNLAPRIFVDDVAKTKPVHFTNSNFRDTVAATRLTAAQDYARATAPHAVTRSPQGFITLLPALGYAFPLPVGFSGEVGGSSVLAYYPRTYLWEEARLPAGDSARASDLVFRGLALNRADGREYAVSIWNSAPLETYDTIPVRDFDRKRIDAQAAADVTLRRRSKRWGSLSLSGFVKKNWSTMSRSSSIWIPSWNSGATLSWNRNLEWP